MKKEHISVKKMWESYLKSIGEGPETSSKTYQAWYFCNNEKSANSLAQLVKQGEKRGTTSLKYLFEVDGEELPVVGCYSIITNWAGIAECIIQTKRLFVLPFEEVNEELAFIEGEGDKSLAYWQKVHIEFFIEELKELNLEFKPDMEVVFEEFEVVFM